MSLPILCHNYSSEANLILKIQTRQILWKEEGEYVGAGFSYDSVKSLFVWRLSLLNHSRAEQTQSQPSMVQSPGEPAPELLPKHWDMGFPALLFLSPSPRSSERFVVSSGRTPGFFFFPLVGKASLGCLTLIPHLHCGHLGAAEQIWGSCRAGLKSEFLSLLRKLHIWREPRISVRKLVAWGDTPHVEKVTPKGGQALPWHRCCKQLGWDQTPAGVKSIGTYKNFDSTFGTWCLS